MGQEEWKVLYQTYCRQLYLYALSLTGSPQDAEDLVQETFIKAYLSYQPGGSIAYWLVVVLKHEWFNLQRRRKKEVLDSGEAILNQVESTQDVLADLIAQEERRMLFRSIQALPHRMGEILMESLYFHLNDQEIAEIHQITPENVRKIRSRAKQKLVERMKEGT